MVKIPVQTIHQLELTSRCNLACPYCAHPIMKRPKVDMTREIFLRCLELVKESIAVKGQAELNLTGIGESTLHPNFVEFVGLAREAVGWQTQLIIATNGILVTDEMAKELAPFKPKMWVSLHRPEKGGPAIEILKKYGLIEGISLDAALAAIDWAGQVKWHVSVPKRACTWVSFGRVMVTADGQIVRCCLDASGGSAIGTVWDNPWKTFTSSHSLCSTCDQVVE